MVNSMKLRIISDLHLESHSNYTLPEMVDDHKQVLILAGDTLPFCLFDKKEYSKFFKDITERFKHVIYIPGNHEYYHGDIVESEKLFLKTLSKKKFNNFSYLNKGIIELEGIKIIGSCLWTGINNGDPLAMALYYKGMNDFFAIKNGKFRLTPEVVRSTYLNHLEYIKDNIEEGSVIITHHAPSHKSITKQYVGDSLNPFFYNELDEMIMDTKPALWVHGHTHSSLNYRIENTRVICNPKGYKNFYGNDSENPYYEPFLVLEV